MKNKVVILTVYLLAAALYIIGPYSIFKVCEVGEKPMRCHWSTEGEIGIAILLIGIAILYGITKTFRERILISIISIITSIVAILIPKVLIGGCGMKTMPCQSRTFPAFYVISLILILVSVVNILYLIKKQKGNE